MCGHYRDDAATFFSIWVRVPAWPGFRVLQSLITMTTSNIISPALRLVTVWVLITGMLLQPVLTYLATPMLMTGSNGRNTVICTLKGMSKVYLDFETGRVSPVDEDCSALQLIDLASSAAVPGVPGLVPVTLHFLGLIDQTADHQHHALYFSAYSSRAPPIV